MPTLAPLTIHRTFTIEQARAALPLVKAILRDLMRWDRTVRHTRFRLQFIRRGGEELLRMFAPEIRALERELQQAEAEVDRFALELQELGIELEGMGVGLVDFPSELQGETVFLCWHCDESTIEYWHSLTGGYPDRQPLAAIDKPALQPA